MIEFLRKLEENLTKSLQLYTLNIKECEKNIALLNNEKRETLHNLIRSNNEKLYTYLESLKDLEHKWFSTNDKTETGECHTKPFLFSFDIKPELYNKNFKNSFKKDLSVNSNVHKLANFNSSNDDVCYIDNIDSIDISPNGIDIPIINNIKDIPPMFYWYNGDSLYKSGIYTCITPGFYVRVPFPNTNASNNSNFKVNSMPCKYITKEACSEIKMKNSYFYKSEIRECSYLHTGEKFIKIGTNYRCNIESFGNHNTLDHDLNFITMNDIKRILMYSLSDTLLSNIWYQNKFKNGDLILANIEKYSRS